MSHARRLAPSLLLLLVLVPLGGCREKVAKVDKPTAPLPPGRGPATYTVRGEIVQLPAGPGRELVIRHEAMPDFVDQSGVKVGMQPMVMPFAVEPGVGVGGLAVGDKVKFVLDVDWQPPRFSIGKLEKLPADTKLDFAPHDAH